MNPYDPAPAFPLVRTRAEPGPNKRKAGPLQDPDADADDGYGAMAGCAQLARHKRVRMQPPPPEPAPSSTMHRLFASLPALAATATAATAATSTDCEMYCSDDDADHDGGGAYADAGYMDADPDMYAAAGYAAVPSSAPYTYAQPAMDVGGDPGFAPQAFTFPGQPLSWTPAACPHQPPFVRDIEDCLLDDDPRFYL